MCMVLPAASKGLGAPPGMGSRMLRLLRSMASCMPCSAGVSWAAGDDALPSTSGPASKQDCLGSCDSDDALSSIELTSSALSSEGMVSTRIQLGPGQSSRHSAAWRLAEVLLPPRQGDLHSHVGEQAALSPRCHPAPPLDSLSRPDCSEVLRSSWHRAPSRWAPPAGTKQLSSGCLGDTGSIAPAAIPLART